MKNIVVKISIVLLFILGLGIALYPIVSSQIAEYRQNKSINTYNDTIKKYKKNDINNLFKEAEKYNQSRSACTDILYKTDL